MSSKLPFRCLDCQEEHPMFHDTSRKPVCPSCGSTKRIIQLANIHWLTPFADGKYQNGTLSVACQIPENPKAYFPSMTEVLSAATCFDCLQVAKNLPDPIDGEFSAEELCQ